MFGEFKMNYEFISISTKRKIGKKKMNEIWDNIIDVLGDNLETAGGKPITAMKFIRMWDIAHE
jgi:hypothetical protein